LKPERDDVRKNSKTSSKSNKSKVTTTSGDSKRSAVSIVRIAADFLQLNKVDPLAFTVMASGAMLAACAGMTNAVAFQALGAFVSHVTGTLTKVGMHTEAGAMSDAGDSLLLVASFALGSVVCGCLISRSTVSFGYALYGAALMVNASLLILAVLTAEHKVAPYLLAAACGLQNGMATSYSGAVIRTTHATGLCTDVGLIIGRNSAAFIKKRVLRREGKDDHTADSRKLFLLLLLGSSFLGGVFLGSVLHTSAGVNALILPACLMGTSGFAYSVYRVFWMQQPLMGRSQSENERRRAKTTSKEDIVKVLRQCEEGSFRPGEVMTLEEADAPMQSKGQELERLLAIVDELEPSLARLLPSPVPGGSDLQAEAMDAHQRLRSVLTELGASPSAETRGGQPVSIVPVA